MQGCPSSLALPLCRQRGLSLYYLRQFEEGAKQVRPPSTLLCTWLARQQLWRARQPPVTARHSLHCMHIPGATVLIYNGTTGREHAPASLSVLPQFRDDVAVNPNDTEESIWAFLCEAQLLGPDQARQQFLEASAAAGCWHAGC